MSTTLAGVVKGAEQVYRQNSLKGFCIKLLRSNPSWISYTRIVDQYINLPKCIDTRLHHPVHVTFNRHIPRNRQGLNPFVPTSLGHSFQHFLAACGEDEIGTRIGKGVGELFAQSIGRSGNQHIFSTKIKHHSNPSIERKTGG